MTPSREKLLARMRNSTANIKRNEIVRLYEQFGFIIREGSSHTIITHPDFPQLRETLPRHRDLAKIYVAKAVALVDQYKRLSGTSDTFQETPDEP